MFAFIGFLTLFYVARRQEKPEAHASSEKIFKVSVYGSMEPAEQARTTGEQTGRKPARKLIAFALLAVIAALLSAMAGCRSHCPPPHLAPVVMENEPAREVEPVVLGGRSLRVFQIGTGPPVIILHEVTGLSPETFRLGRLLAQAGFSVYLPLLFGDPGDSRFVANGWKACAGRWFHCFSETATNDPELIEILLALSRRASSENHRAPVGVIGMCLTGNTGLELARKGSPVRAVVASQPALPFFRPAALGVSEETLRQVQNREVPVLVFRFTGDSRSPHERLMRLKQAIGAHLEPTEIDSSPQNPDGLLRGAHAVLTTELVDEPGHPTRLALDQVIRLFKSALKNSSPMIPTDSPQENRP